VLTARHDDTKRHLDVKARYHNAAAVDFMTFGPAAMALGKRSLGTMNIQMKEFYAANKVHLEMIRTFFAAKIHLLPECQGSRQRVKDLVVDRVVVVPLIDRVNPVYADGERANDRDLDASDDRMFAQQNQGAVRSNSAVSPHIDNNVPGTLTALLVATVGGDGRAGQWVDKNTGLGLKHEDGPHAGENMFRCMYVVPALGVEADLQDGGWTFHKGSDCREATGTDPGHSQGAHGNTHIVVPEPDGTRVCIAMYLKYLMHTEDTAQDNDGAPDA